MMRAIVFCIKKKITNRVKRVFSDSVRRYFDARQEDLLRLVLEAISTIVIFLVPCHLHPFVFESLGEPEKSTVLVSLRIQKR